MMDLEGVLAAVEELSSAQAGEVIRKAVPRLNDTELTQLRFWLMDEPKRREQRKAAEAAKAEMVKTMRDTGTLHAPKTEAPEPSGFDEWVNPAGDPAKAYVAGDKVFMTSTGRVYESVSPELNFFQPTAESETWRDVTDVLFPPPSDETEEGKSKATWDTDLDYKTGDHVVYAGQEYEVIKDHHAEAEKTPDKSPEIYKQI